MGDFLTGFLVGLCLAGGMALIVISLFFEADTTNRDEHEDIPL